MVDRVLAHGGKCLLERQRLRCVLEHHLAQPRLPLLLLLLLLLLFRCRRGPKLPVFPQRARRGGRAAGGLLCIVISQVLYFKNTRWGARGRKTGHTLDAAAEKISKRTIQKIYMLNPAIVNQKIGYIPSVHHSG